MRLICLVPFLLPGLAFAQDQGQDQAQVTGLVELQLVKQVFADLQPISIRDNLEYCGYIGYDADDRLTASPPIKGDVEGCNGHEPEGLVSIIASYHTHGAYVSEYLNEIPSGDDMESDEAEGIDGWVATPGGRLWFIDTQDMVTSQICGIGCLPSDPNFVAGDLGRIAPSYSYDQLVQKIEDLGGGA